MHRDAFAEAEGVEFTELVEKLLPQDVLCLASSQGFGRAVRFQGDVGAMLTHAGVICGVSWLAVFAAHWCPLPDAAFADKEP